MSLIQSNEIYVSNDIKIKNPSPLIQRYAEQELRLDNPEYYKKEALGYYTGATEKTIDLFARDGDTLVLPFGVFADLWKIVKANNLPYSIKTDFAPMQESNLQGEIALYDYQERAVEALLKGKNGVLEGSCGCGKTQMGLALIKKLGLRALWLTHTQKLLKQSKERCERYFKGDFGTITEGHCAIGKDITFATVQTMAKLDPRVYSNAFNVIVVDECHRASGTPTQVHQFYKVLSNCKARYKYGMSATLTRNDGLIKSVFAIIGGKLHTITKEEIGDKTIKAEHVKVDILWRYHLSDYCDTDGTLDYNKMINSICTCDPRNKRIASNVIDQRMKGKKQLILTARVSHAQELGRLIPNSTVVVGDIPERKRNYSGNVLIATYALAKEGLDIPDLDTLHLATPTKDKTTVVQSVGRIERNVPNKATPIVFDYVDIDIPYCENAFTKRKNILRKH